MDALILSCGTGGGHNAAGFAVYEELKRRGHHAEMFDPYALVGNRLSRAIANVYIRMVQKTPRLFGFVYRIGNLYRKLPFRSPVYFFNRKPAKKLEEYLSQHRMDVIIMPHLFPAEMITYMKNKGVLLPKTVFIATDYTCIPFTEETSCDYYIIPHEDLAPEFVARGIPPEKIKPFGIPVNRAFDAGCPKREIKQKLGLMPDKKYLLLAGGSVGAGHLQRTVDALLDCIENHEEFGLIVICGSNKKLFSKISRRCAKRDGKRRKKLRNAAAMNRKTKADLSAVLKQDHTSHVPTVVLGTTKRMADYMKISELFFSKPGGLSSTEAVTAGVLLVHIAPIPGCETKNRSYFAKRRISVASWNGDRRGIRRIEKLISGDSVSFNRKHIHTDARKTICDWMEQIQK